MLIDKTGKYIYDSSTKVQLIIFHLNYGIVGQMPKNITRWLEIEMD